MELDNVDQQLLKLLQTDCKKSTKEYAHVLDLSVTAVYERIKRMERKGAITSYVALVDKKMLERAFVVLCHVKLLQHSREFVIRFEKEVLELEEVVECYHISGDYDYILKIHVRDMDAYRDFMVLKLTALDHIGSTQSSFVISEVKHTTAIPL